MDAKDHIGSPIDLASILMRGDEAKKTIEAGHGGEGGRDLFSGKGAGGREDTRIHAAPVVQQVADCYLQLLRLGEKGQAQWGTGGPGIQRRGGCR